MIDLIKARLPKVKICQFYDMLDYDFNMNLFYHDLKKYIDHRFPDGNIEFSHDERIIFLHADHDFFIDNNVPGFILYNLQLVLRELDIPNNFCLIITQLPNYQRYTKMVQGRLTVDPCPIGSITSSYTKLKSLVVDDIELNASRITKLFSVGSRLSRFHRTYFMAQLFDKKLEDFGFINYYNILQTNDSTYQPSTKENLTAAPCYFLSSIPFTRTYPEIIIKNNKNREIVKNFQQTVKSYSNCEKIDLIKDKAKSTSYQWSELQNSLIYIGLEATVNCPEPYNDEIGFKGIGTKRPFILFGTPGLLSHLRSLGFKTFSDYWDESYDKIEDFEDRVDAILELLHSLSNKSSDELQKMAVDMQPILDYNFNHLKNVLPGQEFNKILTGIAKHIL